LKAAEEKPDGEIEAVTLTRTTYRLPADKAEALGKFLSDYFSNEMEIRVKDHSLQITATAEHQAAIAPFIRLLESHGGIAPKASSPVHNDRSK